MPVVVPVVVLGGIGGVNVPVVVPIVPVLGGGVVYAAFVETPTITSVAVIVWVVGSAGPTTSAASLSERIADAPAD